MYIYTHRDPLKTYRKAELLGKVLASKNLKYFKFVCEDNF